MQARRVGLAHLGLALLGATEALASGPARSARSARLLPALAVGTGRPLLAHGEDIAALWRGRYTTHLGGLRVMRRLGWASVEEMARALLVEPRATPLLAQRGDIVLTDTGLGFGVVIGATAVGLAPEGLTFASLTSCRLAWAV